MSDDLPPITQEGFGGLLLWLLQAARSGKPDHDLLLRGLPQGRIVRARVEADGSIAMIPWDQRDKQERSERYFNPEGFLVLRLVCAPKTRIRYDHNSPELHYLQLFGDISVLRVLADAQKDEHARQVRRADGEHKEHN